MADYRQGLVNRYWDYQATFFQEVDIYFDRPFAPDGRPPVFHRHQAWRNVIVNPDANQEEIDRLLNLLPAGERHKWFRSMNSSQALAQSVFGNLSVYDGLHHLAELKDDEGLLLFGEAQVSPGSFFMEHRIDYLGEPRPTSLDGFFAGEYQVAIECKFTEAQVGSCSRPRLSPSASNYENDFCDGSYTRQRGRQSRCSLTEIGIAYWEHIPALFKWESNTDFRPCPLNRNYQLVRNILAACVEPGKSASADRGHMVLIYDERNPACQVGGHVYAAIAETRRALREQNLLRKCSWQRITALLRDRDALPWLTEQLRAKYGL